MSVKPDYRPSQEVRLAVVMYGGVSLAIYINGVAQEMLRLVRATAPDGTGGALRLADAELRSTEGIYRRLGQTAGRLGDENNRAPEAGSPVRTRFVIDVISGTSAGGINGLFLGKALANGQRLDELQQLWIEEGDIQVLINDRKSVEPPLQLQHPPQSLLNSQRMYAKLLRAFTGMDRSADPPAPYVEELDVFATATDLEGLLVPLHLADGVVFERRHTHVFHLQYAEEALAASAAVTNDFQADHNPFLAFVARCTSSFPFAFEPMSLADIDAVLEVTPPYSQRSDCRSTNELWKKFFGSYLRPVGGRAVPYRERSFGDGGYLDNKPFSYATDTIVKRQAGVAVDRKLIYVEPAPDHPEDDAPRRSKPDALENTLAALIGIPGYETIRGDLQRVLERNRNLERVKRILAQIEGDTERAALRAGEGGAGPRPARGGCRRELPAGVWATLDLGDMLERWGDCYLAYNRLKVSSVTDDLASMFSHVFQLDDSTALFQAMRCLVRAWRDENYTPYRAEGENRPTQNQFLMDFDASYRLRRIRFVLNKVDELYRLNEASDARAAEKFAALLRFRGQQDWLAGEPAAVAAGKVQFREELQAIKKDLRNIYRGMRGLERQLWPVWSGDSKLNEFVTGLEIDVQDLEGLLGGTAPPSRAAVVEGAGGACKPPGAPPVLDEECTERARQFLAANPGKKAQLDTVATGLRDFLRHTFRDPAAASVQARMRLPDERSPVTAARVTVRHYYDCYEDYDMVLFPVVFQTDVLGEGAAVEIIRISPEDATCLMDDRAEARKPVALRKLAGLTFGHFGGFLEREWRKNDIMWGRLDAAERLITTALPNPADEAARLQLIDEAQRLILREELTDAQRSALFSQIAASGASPAALASARRILLDEKQALQDYREKLARRPDPEGELRALARATQVIGKMLEDLARRRGMDTKRPALITRLGRIFWGLVEVAVPRSLPQLLFRYWLTMVYAFAAALIAAGWITSSGEAQRVGWTIFGGTVAAHLAASLLTDYMRRETGVRKSLQAILIVAVAVLALIGIFEATHFAGEVWDWLSAWIRRWTRS